MGEKSLLFIKRYKDLGINIDSLFNNIEDELRREKEFKIVRKLSSDFDEDKRIRSLTAVRASVPKKIEGALRELSVTVVGGPEDFFVEVHIGTWLKSSLTKENAQGKKKTVVDPINDSVGYVPVLDYRNELIERIDEFIRKYTTRKLISKKVESIYI